MTPAGAPLNPSCWQPCLTVQITWWKLGSIASEPLGLGTTSVVASLNRCDMVSLILAQPKFWWNSPR